MNKKVTKTTIAKNDGNYFILIFKNGQNQHDLQLQNSVSRNRLILVKNGLEIQNLRPQISLEKLLFWRLRFCADLCNHNKESCNQIERERK